MVCVALNLGILACVVLTIDRSVNQSPTHNRIVLFNFNRFTWIIERESPDRKFGGKRHYLKPAITRKCTVFKYESNGNRFSIKIFFENYTRTPKNVQFN